MAETVVEIVRNWHSALNDNDVEQVVALAAEDVEVGGPRGITSGREVVREWFGRASLHLYPVHYFSRNNVVVVEERGEWYSPENGQMTSSQVVATLFAVTNRLITRIMRYDDLETALKAAGLDEIDRVQVV